MKKKSKKQKYPQSSYDLGVICEVCDSVTMYDDECGCFICVVCEQEKERDKETLVLEEVPKIEIPTFSVVFSWKEKSLKVKLENGEDVIKLGELFSKILIYNNIPNTLTYENIQTDNTMGQDDGSNKQS